MEFSYHHNERVESPVKLNLVVIRGVTVPLTRDKSSQYVNKLTRIIIDDRVPFDQQLSYVIRREGRRKAMIKMELLTPDHHQGAPSEHLVFDTRETVLSCSTQLTIQDEFILPPLRHPLLLNPEDIFGYYQYAVINRLFEHQKRRAIREYRIEPTYYHPAYYHQNYYRVQLGLIIFYRTLFPGMSFPQALHHSKVTYGLGIFTQYGGIPYSFASSMNIVMDYYLPVVNHRLRQLSGSPIQDPSISIHVKNENLLTIRREYRNGSSQLVIRSAEPGLGPSSSLSSAVTSFLQHHHHSPEDGYSSVLEELAGQFIDDYFAL